MRWDRKWILFAASLGVVAAFFVLREHWARGLGLAPYLLLLACPLMHLLHDHGRPRLGDRRVRSTTDDLS